MKLVSALTCTCHLQSLCCDHETLYNLHACCCVSPCYVEEEGDIDVDDFSRVYHANERAGSLAERVTSRETDEDVRGEVNDVGEDNRGETRAAADLDSDEFDSKKDGTRVEADSEHAQEGQKGKLLMMVYLYLKQADQPSMMHA